MLPYLDAMIAFVAIILFFSIQVTALVQVVCKMAGQREVGLKAGLDLLLKQVAAQNKESVSPSDDEAFANLAEAVSNHHSATGSTKPTAVEAREVILALEMLSDDRTLANQPGSKALAKVISKGKGEATQSVPAGVLNVIKPYLDQFFPDQPDKLDRVARVLETTGEQWKKNLENWFDICMARGGDKYKQFTVNVTVVISIIITFAFQIDSLDILKQLTSDQEITSNISGQVVALLDQQEKGEAAVIGKQQPDSNDEGGNVVGNPDGVDSDAANDSSGSGFTGPGDSDGADSSTAGSSGSSDSIGVASPGSNTANPDGEKPADTGGIHPKIGEELEKILDDSQGLKLVTIGWDRDDLSWQHLLGMAITSILLSLGAPFWFSLLKDLSGLRPGVARLTARNKDKGNA